MIVCPTWSKSIELIPSGTICQAARLPHNSITKPSLILSAHIGGLDGFFDFGGPEGGPEGGPDGGLLGGPDGGPVGGPDGGPDGGAQQQREQQQLAQRLSAAVRRERHECWTERSSPHPTPHT